MGSIATHQAESLSRPQNRANGASGRSRSGPNGAPATAPALKPADQVRRRAFEIFEKRRTNGGGGDALSDWLQAEREVIGTAGLAEAMAQARGETLLHDQD